VSVKRRALKGGSQQQPIILYNSSPFNIVVLSGVSSDEGDGSLRGRRRRGSSPTGTAQHDFRIRMKCWAAMMSSLLRAKGRVGGYSAIPGSRGLSSGKL